MISEKTVIELISSKIEGSDIFVVDVSVGKSNEIRVLVDSMEGVKIEECVALSKWMNAELEQSGENFSLEISSPGVGSPLVMKQQYQKNIGRDVEIVFKDGGKKKGELKEVSDQGITVEVTERQLGEGSQKKKKNVKVSRDFTFDEIKSTVVVITF